MPAVGDQHQPNGAATSNPFDDLKPNISAYTAQEIATLQSRLDKQLGPEYISSRPGAAGQKVHYLAAEKVINLANEVFGFNGWSSAIQNIQIDFIDENAQTGKISLGLSVIVRVTLKDGTFHEDVGYGHIENCKGKAAAFEKCKKEGTTDGLKRALRTFGNVLGNCIYDKDFVAKVIKMKVGAGRWDVNELHRHPDFMPKQSVDKGAKDEVQGDDKGISTVTSLTVSSGEDFEDGFDIAEFDDADFEASDMGHPDEVILPVDSRFARPAYSMGDSNGQMRPPVKYEATTPSRPPQAPTMHAPTAAGRGQTPAPGAGGGPQRMQGLQAVQQNDPPDRNHHPLREQQQAAIDNHGSSSPGFSLQQFAPQQPGLTSAPAHVPPIGFYSAKATTMGDINPAMAPSFNPHAESPSIRKTPGVDHSKSVPLKHEIIAKQIGGQNRDFIDPRSNQARQLGGPGQNNQSPVAKAGGGVSTSAYRPPTRKGLEANPGANMGATIPGGVDRVVAGVRPPLSDLSNVQKQHNVTATTADGAEAKRQRVGGPGGGSVGTENAAGAVGAPG